MERGRLVWERRRALHHNTVTGQLTSTTWTAASSQTSPCTSDHDQHGIDMRDGHTRLESSCLQIRLPSSFLLPCCPPCSPSWAALGSNRSSISVGLHCRRTVSVRTWLPSVSRVVRSQPAGSCCHQYSSRVMAGAHFRSLLGAPK